MPETTWTESIWVSAQTVRLGDLCRIKGVLREVVDMRVIGMNSKLLIFSDGGTHPLRRSDPQLDALRPLPPRPGAEHTPGPGRYA